jgi:hypothetical protein
MLSGGNLQIRIASPSKTTAAGHGPGVFVLCVLMLLVSVYAYP